MKNKPFFLFIIFLFFSNIIFYSCNTDTHQQSIDVEEINLFKSIEYQTAFKNKTRAADGTPGEAYFQNRADYQIKADFIPKMRTVIGEEIITYQNNSPDSLDKIVIHLYQDFYKKGNSRDWSIGHVDLHDGVEIKSIEINNKTIDLNSKNISRYATILQIYLDESLKPNTELELKINWSLVIPKKVNIRHGTYHETSFFVAYWYPKIAVYDDIYGWDTNPYSGTHEFYHEYGNYDVEITVAGDYLVWSSGIFQNPQELLQQKIYDKFIASKTSDEVINIITKIDRENKQILNSKQKNTWKFKAENLPDFAFALSDTYLWDGTSAEVKGERVFVNAVYHETSPDFPKVAEISKQIIELFAEPEIMNYPYPYPQMTAFNGHGGMEFPMMINDGNSKSHDDCVFVTAHEITHSFFPFYVGTNENTTSWLDEGLVTFLPKKIEKILSDDKDFEPHNRIIKYYNKTAGTKHDIQLMTFAGQQNYQTYRFLSYTKSATAFYILREELGEEIFYKCIAEFITRWNGKHPTPYDFFYTFNDVSGENLNWFWEKWFFDLAYADLAIGEITEKNNKSNIEIINKGGLPIPIKLTVTYADESKELIEYKANIWKTNNKTFNIILDKKDIIEIELDTETIPDIFPDDNIKKL